MIEQTVAEARWLLQSPLLVMRGSCKVVAPETGASFELHIRPILTAFETRYKVHAKGPHGTEWWAGAEGLCCQHSPDGELSKGIQGLPASICRLVLTPTGNRWGTWGGQDLLAALDALNAQRSGICLSEYDTHPS
jgi:hypothetical protein